MIDRVVDLYDAAGVDRLGTWDIAAATALCWWHRMR